MSSYQSPSQLQSGQQIVSQSKKLVSESVFELLLIEILNMQYPGSDSDSTVLLQRLDTMGYDVGYR